MRVSFCRTVLQETGVALTPGDDFDLLGGHGWVRLSYATDTASVAEAMQRLEAFCKEKV